MFDSRKLVLVAQFELRDALRSRLALIVGLLFSAGAALATWLFEKTLQASERAARSLIASQTNVPLETVPMERIRERALDGIVRFWTNDPELQRSLLETEPLAIFFGFSTMLAVPFLVLAVSAGTHAADVQSGAARFSLFRTCRVTWALGKMLGHASLLGLGLVLAAVVTGGLGNYLEPNVSSKLWVDLFLGVLRSLLYGTTYLALFSGVSLVATAPLKARAFSLCLLLVLGLGHVISSADWFEKKLPSLAFMKYLFPGEYKMGLLQVESVAMLVSLLALVAIGSSGFGLGLFAFSRRDA